MVLPRADGSKASTFFIIAGGAPFAMMWRVFRRRVYFESAPWFLLVRLTDGQQFALVDHVAHALAYLI